MQHDEIIWSVRETDMRVLATVCCYGDRYIQFYEARALADLSRRPCSWPLVP